MTVALLAICRASPAYSCSKRLVLGVLGGILFAIVHLLLERLRLLFIRERKCGEAVLKLEGVEEHAILIVAEGVVYLLVPYYAAVRGLSLVSTYSLYSGMQTYRYIHQLDPEGVAHQVVR